MIIAWTYLLHAYFKELIIDILIKINQPKKEKFTKLEMAITYIGIYQNV